MSKNPRPADDIDFGTEILQLTTELRLRDSNPDFADAPIIDIYARISKVSDAHDSEKVPRQIVECLRNLIQRHARLGEVFSDAGRSAWKLDGKRPDFEKLMSRMAKGKNDGVLCWHIDRLSRQPWDLEQMIRLVELQKSRKAYVFASCHGDHMLSNLLELRIKMAFAAEESKRKSERIRNNNEHRRAAGIVKGGPAPFGHRFPGDSSVPDVQLSAEREAIEWGIQSIIDGLSLGFVAREWNRRGLTTRAGMAFNPLNVRTVLMHARHGGLLEFEGQILRSISNVERIVPEETYLLMRKVFEGRKRGRQSGERNHFLAGLIRCDNCGNAMMGSTTPGTYSDGQQRRLYRCTPRGCANVAVDARAAEHYAALHVVKELSDPRNAALIAERSSALAKLDRRISQLEKIRSSLHDKAMANPDSYDFYAAKVDETELLLAPLQKKRKDLAVAGAGQVHAEEDVEAVAIKWQQADPALRRIMVEQALPAGFYVAKVGRGRRLRGDDILIRFDRSRGKASERFS